MMGDVLDKNRLVKNLEPKMGLMVTSVTTARPADDTKSKSHQNYIHHNVI